MENQPPLNDPWLIAAWPGMGAVASSSGYYLIAKLGMRLLEEFPAREFFDLESIEVKDGLILTGPLPRSRFFVWLDPHKTHDLVVFIGEAQPPSKGAAFCGKLIEYARQLGVRKVFTFAAMGTQMRPKNASRVFGAAIDPETLEHFKRCDIHVLEKGQISGLNGVLLGVAADYGMKGGCLLGEMPQVFSQFPFPKASLAVLKGFKLLAEITIDFKELQAQAQEVENGLEEFLNRLESSVGNPSGAASVVDEAESDALPPSINKTEKQKISRLFSVARADRSRAYELKQELDRLHVFHQYEDQFLDLFKEPE